MVLVLLVFLFLSLLQVCLHLYTRTLLTAAAAATARYAANADVRDLPVTAFVGDELGGGITGSTRNSLQCNISGDRVVVEVSCSMRSPGLVGLLDGVMPTIQITGHAVREGTR